MRSILRVGLALILLPALVAGCRKSADTTTPSASAQPAGDVKSFPVRGKIVSTDISKGSIVLDHEAIPGFMDAMTMPYPLKDKTLAGELHPGDRITATLLVRKTSDGWEDPQLDHIVVTAQGKPDYKPAVQYHVPAEGDAVPDFKLTNQSGRPIHFNQFKGKAVLITFIYTRCPLPDFCPRMNHNFAEVDKALAADPATYAHTHLLSISFDPKNDTPSVLKDYAQAYAGVGAKFSHWEFAVPPAKELAPLTQWFDVGVSPAEDGTITHSLSTVLIDKEGKVAAFYPSNDWTPAEVVQKMKSVG
ncbi:MAG TPA: SCO family protein [Acidobacteriaceae bacterium]|nr:SCO family protein [Acidobacteriaceae bacterium]